MNFCCKVIIQKMYILYKKDISIQLDMSSRQPNNQLSLTLIEEAILNALMFRERYGLEIMNAIAQASKGAKTIGFSSLYPTLRKLEKRGFVTSRWGDEAPEETTGARRRYYKITGSGLEAVKNKQEFLQTLQTLKPALEMAVSS